jgi:uncharacterized UPF0160 family protein
MNGQIEHLIEYCSFAGGPMTSLDESGRPLERLLESADATAVSAVDAGEFGDVQKAVDGYLRAIAKIVSDATKTTAQQLREIEPLLAAVRRVRTELRAAAEDSPAEMTSEAVGYRLKHGHDKPSRKVTQRFAESLVGRRGNRIEYSPL